MCGRYSLSTDVKKIARHFDLAEDLGLLLPRYNVAPTQDMPVVRVDTQTGKRQLAMLRWGLIPGWAEDPKIGQKLINARAESAAEKPAFRAAFRQRRCLVPADGFYEWQKTGGRKQPLFIRVKGQELFGMAGLWERWEGVAEEATNEPEEANLFSGGLEPSAAQTRANPQTLETFTILTTAANDLLRPIHDRMPVLLAPEDYALWLDPAVEDVGRLEAILRPFPSSVMELYPVSARVNSPRADDPSCRERA